MRQRSIRLIVFFLVILFLPAGSEATCPDLSPAAAQRQLDSLGEEIRYHNQLYYQQAKPIIGDADYDRLFARLVELEGCFPMLAAADSPTRSVGGVAQEQLTITHDRPMLSLDSTTGREAVDALLRRIAGEDEKAGQVRLLVQPKVDGLPVELLYRQGRLVSAATRGDGQKGEDVTARVRAIEGIPETLTAPFPARVVVRGEIYSDLTLFRLGNSAQADPDKRYATPRHLAAATLRSQHPQPWALQSLRLFPFALVNADRIERLHAAEKGLDKLAGWGFPVLPERTQRATTFVEIREIYRQYLIDRDSLPFAVDGIVVKVDDLQLQQRLGLGQRAPFWAAAWKFPPETAVTEVVGIDWRIGRTGKRTPVAELKPVGIGGVQVSRASLHNADELLRLGVVEGARVVVALQGDVIPRIVEVANRPPETADLSLPPEYLPPPALDACLSDGDGCRQQFVARAVYFVSKNGLQISGLGKGRVERLVEAGLVTDLPSFFELQIPQMAALPGFGARTAEKVSAALRAANRPDLERLLVAVGVPGIGPATCKSLARHFDDFDELLLAGRERLEAVPGVNEKAANNLRDFFASPGGERLVTRLRKLEML